MSKVKQIFVSPAQVEIAKKMGITPQQYAYRLQALGQMSGLPVSMTQFNPNKDPVYSIPLSELVNLWRVKFGDTWVDVSELEEDFWCDASARLHKNNKMEEINHRDDSTPWARLKEDA